MTDKQIDKHTPKLRFPDFKDREGWREYKLDDVAQFYKGKGISKNDVSDKGKTPCIRYGELYTHYKEIIRKIKSFTNLPIKELFLSEANDVIIPSSGETREDISTASCVLYDNIAIGGDINVIRTINDGVFLSYYLNNAKKHDIAKIAQGISIIHLYNEQLRNLSIELPCLKEQQKIADCLSSIDSYTSSINEKIEQLKAHKKSLLQKLFPQNGQTVPEYRFPEFEKDGAWTEKKLGEYLVEHKLKSDGQCEVYSVSVSKGVVNQIDYLGRSFSASDTSKYKLVKPFDVIYTKSPTGSFPYGIIKQSFIDHNVIVSPLYGVFSPLNKYIGYIIHLYFESPERTNNYLAPVVKKGAKNTIQISNDTFLSQTVCFPSNPKEQRKIAEGLFSISKIIKLYTAKINYLESQKQGLIQRLFPN